MGDITDALEEIEENNSRGFERINSNLEVIQDNIFKKLEALDDEVETVYSKLVTVDGKQDELEGKLFQLATTLNRFIEEDRNQKALQLAETKMGNLKQELHHKYGYYAEIRRMATGILQGVDTGIVQDDTLRHTTEEVMIKAPGYWLAPTLVALTAWIRDDKETTEKALKEALRVDDYRTSLFFLLVMRRLSRNTTSLKWLERYFMHQDPHNLDREFIVILEAVTTGVFLPASRILMMTYMKNWLDQLTQSDEFVDYQKEQWIAFFEASDPILGDDYPLLEIHATNWKDLEESMEKVKTNKVLLAYFTGIFETSADVNKKIKEQLDEILNLLVTNFDAEEIPLREKVRFNELIIEMNGNINEAQKTIDAEKHVFDEKVDLLQLLTNAAFNPEMSGATKTTQALAISISQPWITSAFDSYTAQIRSKIPSLVKLNIDDFETQTKDGTDEKELLQKQSLFYNTVLQNQLNNLSFPYAGIGISVLVLLLGVYFTLSEIVIGIIGIAIGGFLIWNALNKHNKEKELIKEKIAERKKNAIEVLRGCIVETVDYRKEHKEEDEQSEKVRNLINNIKPEDFSSTSKETRTIIK